MTVYAMPDIHENENGYLYYNAETREILPE